MKFSSPRDVATHSDMEPLTYSTAIDVIADELFLSEEPSHLHKILEQIRSSTAFVAAACNWLRPASMTRLREMCPDWAKQTDGHYLEQRAFLSTLCCPRFSTDSSLLRVACTLASFIPSCKLFSAALPERLKR